MTVGTQKRGRLAVFVDQIYWFDGQVYSTDDAYFLFLKHFTAYFEEVVFVGRLSPEARRMPYPLDEHSIKFCPLPYYESLYHLWKAGVRLYGPIRNIVRKNAAGWDAILVGGPNPVGHLIAKECLTLGRPVFFLVRQNLPRQLGSRYHGIKRWLTVGIAEYFEWQFKRLARNRTVFAVGEEMANAYGQVSGRVHLCVSSLVTTADWKRMACLVRNEQPGRLLFVGRLSEEKGVHHLITALNILTRNGTAWTLDIVGEGPVRPTLAAQAEACGIGQQIKFHGYVPYGPELYSFYQNAQILIAPSLPGEGFPKVVGEALSSGLPVITSRVAGIPGMLTHDVNAVLVPPGDPSALAAAIEQLLCDRTMRERLRENGRSLMRDHTLEAEQMRMVHVIELNSGISSNLLAT